MAQKTLRQRIIQFPLTHIAVGLLACGAAMMAAYLLAEAILKETSLPKDWQAVAAGMVAAGATVATYIKLYRKYEQREITELYVTGMGRNLGLGMATGTGLLAAVALAMFVCGYYRVITVNDFAALLPALGISIFSGVAEEILMRGIVFRITEEKLGSIWALVISGLLFGIMHIANPHSSWFMAMCIAIEAGLLLGAAYIYSRSLWLPIAIHFAWNFAEAGIFGFAVSGNDLGKSLLTPQINGPELLTGGNFGPEGSLLAIFFCLCAFAAFMYHAVKAGRLIQPFWVKPADVQPLPAP